jgi:endonuclease/exonuclease/phosphatase family metal-dependent hydrolase
MKPLSPLVLGALVALGCADDPTMVAPPPQAVQVAGHGAGITVMTRNMYVGANVDPIIAATDPNQVPLLVAQAFQQLLQTNYPLRAGLIADEIAAARPHLVGLQEVSLIRIQSPGDLVVGGTVPATQVLLDFLPILLAQLAARGLDYRVVATVQNTDVELPMVTSPTPTFDDVRLTDFDVLLARGDVATANPHAQNFAAFLPVPGTPIVVRRGFVAVDAAVGGTTYRVVNTHLESVAEALRLAQAQELLAYLAGETRPTLALGDFNTDAELAEPTYQLLTGAGFADTWLSRAGGPTQRLTCCHAADLANATPALGERIDLILTRGLPAGPAFADVVGDDPDERAGGLWASDHAGVVARLPRN